VRAGPSAFLAFSRSDYRRWAVRFRDAREELAFSGIWRLAAHYPAVTWNEFRQDVSPAAYTRALSRYLPAIKARDLTRGPIGLRAQAMTPSGQLLDDFELRRDGRTLHVVNAPSPAATACLAIGEYLAGQLIDAA
jgi:L-2-hydroxyglutarate oxidase